jgi:hypothetical protein
MDMKMETMLLFGKLVFTTIRPSVSALYNCRYVITKHGYIKPKEVCYVDEVAMVVFTMNPILIDGEELSENGYKLKDCDMVPYEGKIKLNMLTPFGSP